MVITIRGGGGKIGSDSDGSRSCPLSAQEVLEQRELGKSQKPGYQNSKDQTKSGKPENHGKSGIARARKLHVYRAGSCYFFVYSLYDTFFKNCAQELGWKVFY